MRVKRSFTLLKVHCGGIPLKDPLPLLTPLHSLLDERTGIGVPSLLTRPTSSTPSPTSPPSASSRPYSISSRAIGYGRGHHLGRTGDGGIDGIVEQDPLGLDSIYVQAKRWKKPVGEPEVRTFSGSLDPHGATRGLLITTSSFTDTARRTAETISAGHKHIRLVDGEELAQLMISLDMGVETANSHRARKVDEDHPAQRT